MRAPSPSSRASALPAPPPPANVCAFVLAALATGESRIEGLAACPEVQPMAAALREFGVAVDPLGGGAWRVRGVGTGALLQPRDALHVGGEASAALLLGLAASHPITVTLVGTALPEPELIAALATMGAVLDTAPGGRLPLRVRGLCPAVPIAWDITGDGTLAWGLLVAGLNTPGETRLRFADPAAFDTSLLAAFGVPFEWLGGTLTLRGEADLRPAVIRCPRAA